MVSNSQKFIYIFLLLRLGCASDNSIEPNLNSCDKKKVIALQSTLHDILFDTDECIQNTFPNTIKYEDDLMKLKASESMKSQKRKRSNLAKEKDTNGNCKFRKEYATQSPKPQGKYKSNDDEKKKDTIKCVQNIFPNLINKKSFNETLSTKNNKRKRSNNTTFLEEDLDEEIAETG
jgi:hypothetical protein